MEFSDDDGVNKRHKPSRAANLRPDTSVSKLRGNKANSKESVTERQKETFRPNRENDKEDVENISHNKEKTVQLGKDQKLKNESVLDRIAIVVATIAVFVALYPHFLSFVPSKPDTSVNVGPKDIQKLQKVTKELSERLSVLENELSTIKQFTEHPYHSVSIDENLKVQNRDRKTESDLSREINVNREKLKDLKHEVLTMKDHMNLKFKDIKHMQEEHKKHQAEMVHFNAKVVERLQFVENRTADVSMQISQHNNSLFDLNLHVDNFVSNLHTMNESVMNRLMATKHDMLGRLNTNNMETERLKDVLQKIKEVFQTNITTLEEQSRSAETKNTAMMQQISHQSETLKVLTVSGEAFNKRLSNLDVYVKQHDTNLQSLNVSVENQVRNQVIINRSVQNISSNISSLKVSVESHDSSLRNLNASVDRLDIDVKRLTENITGISIETLVLDRRTEHIVDNIIDKELVRDQNGRMLDEIIRNFGSEKKVKNVLLVGLPSAGKSSLINSLVSLILGKYIPVASVGQGVQLSHTYAAHRYNHLGIKAEHLRESPNEENARLMHPHLPNLYDFVGLGDANTEELKEILSLQIFGHLEPGIQITGLLKMQATYGVGSLTSWYTKSKEDWKIDVIIFVHSVATSEVPRELIQCVLDVIKPKDSIRPVDVELYVVLTKMDKVQTGEVTEESVTAIENTVADLFGFRGFKEYKLVKITNWCEDVGFPDFSADDLDGSDERSVTLNNQLLKLLRNMSISKAMSSPTHDITLFQKTWFYLYGCLSRHFHFQTFDTKDILFAVLFGLLVIISVFILMSG